VLPPRQRQVGARSRG